MLTVRVPSSTSFTLHPLPKKTHHNFKIKLTRYLIVTRVHVSHRHRDGGSLTKARTSGCGPFYFLHCEWKIKNNNHHWRTWDLQPVPTQRSLLRSACADCCCVSWRRSADLRCVRVEMGVTWDGSRGGSKRGTKNALTRVTRRMETHLQRSDWNEVQEWGIRVSFVTIKNTFIRCLLTSQEFIL